MTSRGQKKTKVPAFCFLISKFDRVKLFMTRELAAF